MYYATARLTALSQAESNGGNLDFMRIWSKQRADELLERQLLTIAEAMMTVLRSPPQAGQNITEWAIQPACRTIALAEKVPVLPGFDHFLISKAETRSAAREQKAAQRVTDGLSAVTEVMNLGADTWRAVRDFTRERNVLSHDDQRALAIACAMPRYVPTDKQAERLRVVLQRCKEIGFEHLATPADAK